MKAYVVINRNYTATVHAVEDLAAYIKHEPKEVDLEVFQVTIPFEGEGAEAPNEALKDLIRNTRRDLLKARGFASFNDCLHTCVDLGEGLDETRTITAKYNGEQVTFAFIPTHDRKAECVDIARHPLDTRQRMIMFDGGTGRVDAEGTLGTLMLKDLKPLVRKKGKSREQRAADRLIAGETVDRKDMGDLKHVARLLTEAEVNVSASLNQLKKAIRSGT